MPQGKVIEIKPLSFTSDKLSEEELQKEGCEGEVAILEGGFSGQVGHFRQDGKCCRKKKGDKVEVEVLGTDSEGKVLVEIIKC